MQLQRRLLILAVGVLTVSACGSAVSSSPALTTAPTTAPTAAGGSVAPSAASDPVATAAAACPSPSLAAANKIVDTTSFKKDPPWTLGVSFGELADSWTAFNYAEVKYAASKDSRFGTVIGTNAAFDVSKQVADIEDMITKKVDGIIYLPVDDGALTTVLQKANAAGIPTIDEGNGFSDHAGITANAQIDNYVLGREVAVRLMESIKGKGQILSIIPIAGTTAATLQDAALQCVLKLYPEITLLDQKNGDWDTAKSKTIAEAWVQRYPKIDGIFSPSGLMSHGVVEALDEAGRLADITMSPGDESNGWLKWIAANPNKNAGLVLFPPVIGTTSVDIMGKILSGTSVPFGSWTGANYIDPAASAALANPAKGDDWWPNDLPGGDVPK